MFNISISRLIRLANRLFSLFSWTSKYTEGRNLRECCACRVLPLLLRGSLSLVLNFNTTDSNGIYRLSSVIVLHYLNLTNPIMLDYYLWPFYYFYFTYLVRYLSYYCTLWKKNSNRSNFDPRFFLYYLSIEYSKNAKNIEKFLFQMYSFTLTAFSRNRDMIN